ncbi:MAG: prephenate dehydrogenase/arogenate dehydrogenase family protein [Gemmatimonadota bacterium]|jgi:chorismate mutase/prephenate dehydrogenase
MTDRLEDLRARIAAIDAGILRLVSDRLALVRDVGAAKREAGLAVRSYGAEQEVLSRFHLLAGELGLDEKLAERIAHLLIGAAVRQQEEAQAPKSERARRILIVGGAGKMGRWLGRFFAGQGHEVTTLDPYGPVPGFRAATHLVAAVREAEVVLVATPLAPGKRALQDVLSIEPAALVIDIFSLKSHVLDLLEGAAAHGLRVASLHPLFGPSVRTLSGRVMAVCDCGNSAAADEAAALFADTALTITRIPVAEHDAFMQYVLGLSHLTAILFATTLAQSGRSFGDLAAMASTTFYKESRTAAEVARENPYLYFEIQNLNRHSAELFALVKESLATVEAAALGERPDKFVELMEKARVYFPETLPAELG